MAKADDPEKKVYGAHVYILAAFALIFIDCTAEEVKSLNRREDFTRVFQSHYGIDLDPQLLDHALELMSELSLIVRDDDPYAGEYISLQKTGFVSQFKNVSEDVPDSPLPIALRGRKPWMQKVLQNGDFWAHANREDEDSEANVGDHGSSIPASNRTVTLLHNSPERAEINDGLNRLSEALRTSNEVAAELGDDRERLTAEVEAARAGVKPEKIRQGFIKDTVLRVLRELGTKLKDKAMDLGIDRLIIIFEKLLDHVL